MKTTVQLTEAQAAALRSNAANLGCSDRMLPESLHEARQKKLAEPLATEASATRGQRRAVTMIPKNQEARMLETEEKAWSHSDVAGVLWENGLRFGTVMRLCQPEPSHTA